MAADEMTIPKIFHDFLIDQAHTELYRHSGRNLFVHLRGTYWLLGMWGASEDVCKAGLFHSIYGTKQYATAAWDIHDRDTICQLIGGRAETLVYLFCVLNRPAGLVSQALVCDRRFGNRRNLEPGTLRDLREVEVANLIEQGGGRRWLRKLRDTDISDAAKRAIDILEAARAIKESATG